jgi:hypothetical protein
MHKKIQFSMPEISRSLGGPIYRWKFNIKGKLSKYIVNVGLHSFGKTGTSGPRSKTGRIFLYSLSKYEVSFPL